MLKENNFSIGVDIESIARFSNLKRRESKNFLEKIFTEKELDYCLSKENFAQHLASHFAAKEAVVKALGSFRKKPIALSKIVISHSAQGVPAVTLKGYSVKISLSHCEDKAVAFVMVKKQ